ncbi:hypothetical protein SXCC_02587 [Gluconacetobacter sp. SXCC-1]|nr:hypothetical protein SXCC_02587 [Gluconacetobacter sp. SXCC-1]
MFSGTGARAAQPSEQVKKEIRRVPAATMPLPSAAQGRTEPRYP